MNLKKKYLLAIGYCYQLLVYWSLVTRFNNQYTSNQYTSNQ